MNLTDLQAIIPIFIVVMTALITLAVEAFRRPDEKLPMGVLGLIGLVGAAAASFMLWGHDRVSLGVVRADNFALFVNGVLITAGILTILFSGDVIEREELPAGEYYALVLFAISGMAVVTLALGIGANTAIFSVISAVLLKPLPYPRSEELVVLDHSAPGLGIEHAGAAPFLYFTYREDSKVFTDVAMWGTGTVSVTGLAKPEEIPALFTTGGLLPILGVQPMLGRGFSKADDEPGGAQTVLLTAGYWRSKFGGDRAAVGRTITLDGEPREIIGVLPDGFRFLDRDVSIVVPDRIDRSKVFLGQFSYAGLARLKPGESIERAKADAARMIPIGLKRFPPFPGASLAMFEKARITPDIRTLKDDLVGDIRDVLWVLMGTIGM